MTRRAPLVLALLGALLALAAGAWAQVGGGFDLTWSTIDSGGGTAQGGAFTLDGTVGQADAGTLSGGPFTLAGGFWPGVEPTPTPTPTPPCTPRPNVGLSVTPNGDGRLRVVLTANTNPGAPPNAIQSIQFQALDNATVQVPAQPGVGTAVTVTSPTTVTLAPASSPVTLFVSRVTSGQASTVRVVVTDGCGGWPTFFGGGPSAF